MLNAEFWLVSLTLSSKDFLRKWRRHLDPDLLTKGSLGFILQCSLYHWDTFKHLMDRPALLSYLTEATDEERDLVLEAYDAINSTYQVTSSSEARAFTTAIEWLQGRLMGQAMDKATRSLGQGNREEAFSTLLELREATGTEVAPAISMDPLRIASILADRPNEEDAIPTGLPEFDQLWAGGIYPGNLGIILAPTNVGKSQLLCYLAASAYLANKSVLFYTYELTKLQVFERILSSLFNCPAKDFGPDPGARLQTVRDMYELNRAGIDVDNGMERVSDLVALLKAKPYDLVILDSADDMRPVGQHQNTYTALGEIYTDIHIDVCQGLLIPVWTSTQATREAVDKARFGLKFMGDSFKKAQRAHLILALSQTEGELQSEKSHAGPLMTISVIKDTLHGSKGKNWRYACKFPIPNGGGFPAFRLFDEGSQV